MVLLRGRIGGVGGVLFVLVLRVGVLRGRQLALEVSRVQLVHRPADGRELVRRRGRRVRAVDRRAAKRGEMRPVGKRRGRGRSMRPPPPRSRRRRVRGGKRAPAPRRPLRVASAAPKGALFAEGRRQHSPTVDAAVRGARRELGAVDLGAVLADRPRIRAPRPVRVLGQRRRRRHRGERRREGAPPPEVGRRLRERARAFGRRVRHDVPGGRHRRRRRELGHHRGSSQAPGQIGGRGGKLLWPRVVARWSRAEGAVARFSRGASQRRVGSAVLLRSGGLWRAVRRALGVHRRGGGQCASQCSQARGKQWEWPRNQESGMGRGRNGRALV